MLIVGPVDMGMWVYGCWSHHHVFYVVWKQTDLNVCLEGIFIILASKPSICLWFRNENSYVALCNWFMFFKFLFFLLHFFHRQLDFNNGKNYRRSQEDWFKIYFLKIFYTKRKKKQLIIFMYFYILHFP